MAESVDDVLRSVSVDEMYKDYKDGIITRGVLNRNTRDKAKLNLKDEIDKSGYSGALLENTIEHTQKAYDLMLQDLASGKDSGLGIFNPIPSVMMLWHAAKGVSQTIGGFGEVNGAKAEMMMLAKGASPGWARWIGMTVDVGSNFVPVKVGARALQKGVQKVFGAATEVAAGKEDEAAIQFVHKVVEESLKAEGLVVEKIAATATEAAKTIVKKVQDPLNLGKRPKLAPIPQITSGLDILKSTIPKFGAEPTEKEFQTLRTLARTALKEGTQDAETNFAKYMAAFFSPTVVKQTKSLMVGRGAHGSVQVQFPDINHADLYSAIGRSRKLMSGKVGMDPDWKGLAARFGATLEDGPSGIGSLAVKYREQITEAVKGLKEGSVYRAADISGQVAEVSQKINYSKQMMGLLTEWAPAEMAKGDIRAAMKTLAQDISVLSVKQLSGGSGRYLIGKAREQGGFFEGIREIYNNMLLPLSFTSAAVGNSVSASMALAKRFSISPTEAFYMSKGMFLATSDAMKALGNTYFKQYTSPTGRQMGPGRFDYPVTGALGKMGRIIYKPTETVLGMDNLFTTWFTRGSHYAWAAREGIQQGLSGLALGKYVKQQASQPNDEMIKEARRFSKELTFQNQLDPFSRKLQSWVQHDFGAGFRPGAFFFPFMRSAIDLTKFSWNHSPGLQMISTKLWQDMAAGGARGDEAVAKLIMGNMLGMYFYELAKEGLITGSGPADPALKQRWLADGNKEHSMKLPDGRWISHTNIEPLSSIMSMIADFTMISDQIDDMGKLQMAHAITYAIVHNLGNNTWWAEANKLVDVVSGNMGYETSMKVFMQPALNMYGGSLMTQASRIADPTTREARTFVEQFQAKTPVWSKSLKPLRDGYGDRWIPQKPAISSWFGLAGQAWLKIADTQNDPIKKEGERLEARISKFPDTVGVGPVESPASITPQEPGRVQPMSRITDAQKERWQQIYKAILHHPTLGMEKKLINTPNYQALPVAGQRAQFEGQLSDYKNAAKDILISEDKGLGRKIYNNQAQADILKLAPEKRPAFEQKFERAMTVYDNLDPQQIKNIMKWGDTTIDDTPPDESGLSLRVAPTGATE